MADLTYFAMEGIHGRFNPTDALPPDCWHHVLECLGPRELARASLVCRTSNVTSCDDRLWSPRFRLDWSPEACVSPSQQSKLFVRSMHDIRSRRHLCTAFVADTTFVANVSRSCFLW
jgi:hypothetical protein